MEDAELACLHDFLERAGTPEEVFGPLTGDRAEMLAGARNIYRRLAKVAHPDRYQEAMDCQRAGIAFRKLERFWSLASAKIAACTYGAPDPTESFEPFILYGNGRQYSIERLLTRGDLCVLYPGFFVRSGKQVQVVLKVPVKPGDNDLVAQEARVLRHLSASAGYEQMCPFVSQLLDHFAYREASSGSVRQVNVLSYLEGFFSLTQVREVYRQGIDPKDMAWIWRRLLMALGFAHACGVIHGSVLPTHILIHPRLHGVVLIDWSYALIDPTETGETLSAISSQYRDWYPAEVFARKTPTTSLDIALAARCMVDLLGGNARELTLPASTPWQLHHYLQGCISSWSGQKPPDARHLLAEFDLLIERLWGPKTFHEFTMPTL